MKNIIALLAIMLFSGSIFAQMTGVLHYLPILSTQQVNSYKGYDFIVVDHEVIITSPNSLRLMRQDNPDLKIFVYANKIEWHSPMFPDKPWSMWIVDKLKKYPQWFLKGTDGKKLEFWPNTVLMNCRLDCPRYTINGKSYSYIEYFTKNYIKDIIKAYEREGIHLDGMLDDELLKKIDFIGNYEKNQAGVDSDEDGVNDEPEELNREWRLGNAYFLKTVRAAMGNEFIIIGNGGHGYYMQWCQIKMFEYFPEVFLNESDKLTEAWPENMRNASAMPAALFNARANAYGKTDNWYFTLCSGMLLDNVLFTYGQNTPYDSKYKLNLGKPLDTFSNQGGIIARRYQKGVVKVDPFNKKAWIEK